MGYVVRKRHTVSDGQRTKKYFIVGVKEKERVVRMTDAEKLMVLMGMIKVGDKIMFDNESGVFKIIKVE